MRSLNNDTYMFSNVFLTPISPFPTSATGIDAQDEDGDTPLHVAYRMKALNIVRELEKAGANTTIKNNLGLTPSEAIAEEEQAEDDQP